jgi:hypothetical protein
MYLVDPGWALLLSLPMEGFVGLAWSTPGFVLATVHPADGLFLFPRRLRLIAGLKKPALGFPPKVVYS